MAMLTIAEPKIRLSAIEPERQKDVIKPIRQSAAIKNNLVLILRFLIKLSIIICVIYLEVMALLISCSRF